MKVAKNGKIKAIIIVILIIVMILSLFICGCIIDFLYSNNKYYKHEKDICIPIFVYHNIVEEMTGPDYMQTTEECFVKQITGLKKFGYEIIKYDDLISYTRGEKKLKEKVAIITFDDGWETNYKNLFPIVKQYNIPVTINVIDSNIGTEGYLNWEQIKEMSDSGLVDIYSHSRYHRNPNTVDTQQYVKDIEYSHNHIQEQLGKNITKVFTYPYGMYDEDKRSALNSVGFIQNLTDNKVNKSSNIDLSKLHRQYPLNDSIYSIILKTMYRSIRYN